MRVTSKAYEALRRLGLKAFRIGLPARCGDDNKLHKMAADEQTGDPVPSCHTPISGWDWVLHLRWVDPRVTAVRPGEWCEKPGCRNHAQARWAQPLPTQLELDTMGEQRVFRLIA